MSKYGIELQDIFGEIGKTPENVADDLMNKIKIHRKEAKMSRKLLAKLSGVKESTLRYAENTGKISLANLLRLADALGYLDEFRRLMERPYFKRHVLY